MFVGEDTKDEVGIEDEDGAGGGVDAKMDEKQCVNSKNLISVEKTYLL